MPRAACMYSTPSNLIFVIIDEMMSTTKDERPDENSSNLQDKASTPPGRSLNVWDELLREPESDGVSNPGSSHDNGVSIDSLHDVVSNAGSPHDVVSDVASLHNVSSSSGSPHEVSCSSGSDTITCSSNPSIENIAVSDSDDDTTTLTANSTNCESDSEFLPTPVKRQCKGPFVMPKNLFICETVQLQEFIEQVNSTSICHTPRCTGKLVLVSVKLAGLGGAVVIKFHVPGVVIAN